MLRRLLLVPVALAFAAPGTEISFAPEEGLELTKTCEMESELELRNFSISINGEQMELEEQPEGTNGSQQRLVVADSYDAVEGGRATKLTRKYEEGTLHEESSGTSGETDSDKESALAGKTVVFTWDEDAEGGYAAEFGADDEGADEDLLKDLDAGLDFAGFLPDDEVDEGDSWTVEATALGALFSFGGDLKFDDKEDDVLNRLINEAFEERLTGDVTCTLKGLRDEDGRSLAVIAIEADASGEAEYARTQELGESGYDIEVATAVECTVELEGELVWDVAGGHFASLRMKGDVSIDTTESGSADLDGQSFEQEVEMDLAGTISFSFEAE